MTALIPKTREEKIQFITAVGVAAFIGFVSVASVIISLLAIINNLSAPRIHYTEANLLSNYVVCPGDVLSFEVMLDIDAEEFRPTQILITVSIWDVDNDRTVEFEEIPRYSAWTEPTYITYVEMHTIPDIPPGNYQVRHATLMFSGGNDVISIPFIVSSLCD